MFQHVCTLLAGESPCLLSAQQLHLTRATWQCQLQALEGLSSATICFKVSGNGAHSSATLQHQALAAPISVAAAVDSIIHVLLCRPDTSRSYTVS